MRLLIVTQAVDEQDSNLGFFIRWIEEFARQCERVSVVCLREGVHHLPENVRVYSLGKEKGEAGRFAHARRFVRFIRAERDEYDAILVHMNPEYVILGGPFWRAWRKRVALWYVHKRVNLRLRLAAHLSDYIFTASRESFRLPSKKVRVVGHGIDIALFGDLERRKSALMRVVTVGRISRTKRLIEMLAGIKEVAKRGIGVRFSIIGAPITSDDREYEERLRAEISRLGLDGIVEMKGPIPYARLPEILRDADVMLNFSETGSMDKAVLDAFAAGVPVVTSNEAFASVPVALHLPEISAPSVADAIERARLCDPETLKRYVVQHHSLPRLAREITRVLAV